MKIFYLQWGALLIVATGIVCLTYQHYQKNLATMSPQQVLTASPTGTIRVLGLVQGGSLEGQVEAGQAQFILSDDQGSLPVTYQGPTPENLRELKKLIAVGRWDPQNRMFQSHELALVTNYGFVISAYVIGLLPLALFVFAMGRKVSLLYEEIKASKLYQSEWEDHVDTA